MAIQPYDPRQEAPIPANQPKFDMANMSSREMADLTEKRHDSVKRTIDTLAEKGTIQLPQIVEVTNHLGQTVTEYRIGKRDSYVIVAQLSPEFTARLVDRWQELEAQVPQLPDFNDPVASARAWADQTEARRNAEKLATDRAILIEQQAPKVDFFDRVVEREALMNATQVGQKLKLSAIKLNAALEELEVYNSNVKRGRAFRQWFVDKGYGIMKQTEVGYPQALFTTAGGAWVVQKLIGEGY